MVTKKETKPKFYRERSYPYPDWKIQGESETIPGQALSVEQYIRKYQQGEIIPVFNALYDDNEDIPIKSDYDLSEQDNALETLKMAQKQNEKANTTNQTKEGGEQGEILPPSKPSENEINNPQEDV